MFLFFFLSLDVVECWSVGGGFARFVPFGCDMTGFEVDF
jgi:hypothetical protein